MALPSACTSGLRWCSSEENEDKGEKKEEREEDLDERLEMVLQRRLCPLGEQRLHQRIVLEDVMECGKGEEAAPGAVVLVVGDGMGANVSRCVVSGREAVRASTSPPSPLCTRCTDGGCTIVLQCSAVQCTHLEWRRR